MKAKRGQLFLKRLVDLMFSIFVLLLFLPLWIFVAILIKLTSKGPVFFVQNRPGKNKSVFKIYKFRTMKLGSEIMTKGKEVMCDDDRVTALGKFLRRTKIDEIPQIFNILKGDMSLVGPRPERIASLEDYDDEISKRLYVRPGITGLAQVSGNIYLDLKDRYRYDILYVEHFSIMLDIRILLRTVLVILLGENIFKNKPLIKI